ncbi:DUF5682 family protein [Streptomyces antibioticus]|uniref:DUF5682 family protein n=1 Tax=Streptomyces antibioticus TaxID=1890 RepID=UPI0033D3FCF3
MTGVRSAGVDRRDDDTRWPALFGVRHHGPGSARAVRAALDAARPRVVLIEGPPEADALIPLAAEPDMRPPVALLAHAVDEPGRSAFWPMAGFSPEWVALRWALEHGVPARFIDLPATHTLAWQGEEDVGEKPDITAPHATAPHTASPHATAPHATAPHTAAPHAAGLRADPLGTLAAIAGYDDAERWWEDVVEHRTVGTGDPFAPFTALEEAMEALREAADGDEVHGEGEEDARGRVREAYMRLRVRAARKEFGDDGVAVVCGAWHVPALRRPAPVVADRALLKGLPKVRAELTWVPWTHRRLARAGGYGAGIDAPGWYAHLFDAQDRPVERWLTKVAGLLREEDRIVSPAHVIDAVRLAETLAALRGRPLPGLSETADAVRAALCEGSDVPAALVHDRLVVGDVLGEVPAGAPAVPLQRDLDRLQRRLRLRPEAAERELELDLRKETDAARGRLLHRLRLLGVGWGEPVVSRSGTGTFRETWRLRWEPELSVRVAEAGVWGTTVRAAANTKAEEDAVAARGLVEVTALAEHCLLAGLSRALPAVMRVLADRAALDTDVGHLAQALPALVRSLRYGDVRGTDTRALAEVAAGLAERVFVGLPPACAALDGEAAEEMRRHVDAVHGVVGLLEETGVDANPGANPGEGPDEDREGTAAPAGPTGGGTVEDGADDEGAGGGADGGARAPGGGEGGAEADGSAVGGGKATRDMAGRAVRDTAGLRARWRAVLRLLAGRNRVPGLIRGRAVRLSLDDGDLDPAEAARLMGLALSPGAPPGDAAAWIEGFVGGAGGGLLLVHDERLLALVDGWLTGVPAESFTDVLPLLRRTFSAYEEGVRRTLGELVRRGPGERAGPRGAGPGARGFADRLDGERADAVLPVVRLLLGQDDERGPGGNPEPAKGATT